MTTPAEIIAAARETLGTPFRHQGRLVGRGLDCAGVVVYVAARLGLPYVDVPGYSRFPHDGLLRATLDDQPGVVRVSAIAPGDILLMRFGREPQHLAIATAGGIIHGYESVGRVVEHDLDARWRRRVVGIYRFTGVA